MNDRMLDQSPGAEAHASKQKPWAKPVVTETSVLEVTEAGAGPPPSDAVSGFYQS